MQQSAALFNDLLPTVAPRMEASVAAPPVDSEAFRHALRQKAAAVTIVTTRSRDIIHGMTATSVTGICLSPPLMLVCLANGARTHQFIAEAHIFAINFLKQEQRALAACFAGQACSSERFQGLPLHRAVTGAPILDDCLAYFDCVVVAAHPAGDHTIFIGQVCATGNPSDGMPLVYHNRTYFALG